MANGAGSIYLRGRIWWVQIWQNGKAVMLSSKSTLKSEAIKFRNRLLAKKERGELSGGQPDKVLIGELLDDVLKSDIKETTRYVWERSSRKHQAVFREDPGPATFDGCDGSVPREKEGGGLLRRYCQPGAFHCPHGVSQRGKRTPPKVHIVPYFPMVQETTVRKGFLTDVQHEALRDALPSELKALFVTAYITGIRKGELLAVTWRQVDFETRTITLETGETKNSEARSVPIIAGDMHDLLIQLKRERETNWPGSIWVFSRQGERIKDFRWAWDEACQAAGVEDLNFHDLRRTAVRNMRRAGIPQVIRMKISGHKTDSMERRYNIVDAEDLNHARELLERRIGHIRKPSLHNFTHKKETARSMCPTSTGPNVFEELM